MWPTDRRVPRVDERRVHDAADPEGRRHADAEGYYRSWRHAPDVPYSFRYGGDGRVVHVEREEMHGRAHALHGDGRDHLRTRLRTHWIHGAAT